LSRTYKEFRRGTATIADMKKIRSVLFDRNQKVDKRVPIGAGMSVLLNDSQQADTHSASTTPEFYMKTRILANAWALSGNYRVQSKKQPPTQITMMTLQQALDYCDYALRCSVEQGNSSLKWLEDRDTATRKRMVMHMRRGWPASEALQEAIVESKLDWEPPQLMHHRPQGDDSEQPPKRPRKAQEGGQPAKQDSGSQRSAKGGGKPAVRTATTLSGGLRLCKPFNDDRGCTAHEKDCPTKSKHLCDRILDSGRICAKPHPRCSS
jgi:hypothetical protein